RLVAPDVADCSLPGRCAAVHRVARHRRDTKIVLVALATVFPMYLNTYNGVRSVDRRVLEAMRSFGLSGPRLVRQVVFPLALPSILTGLRFALGISVLALIAAEQINSSAGLGYLMLQAQTYQQVDVLVVCI